MLISDSELKLRRRCTVSTAALLCAALVFFLIQNLGYFPGGGIAVAKLFWLGTAIYFWYVIPALVLGDHRVSSTVRRIYSVFLGNMVLRGVIELFMMYVTLSWHPYYGLAHDLFSLALLALLISKAHSEGTLDIWMKLNASVMASLFVVEFLFASYMLVAVKSNAPVYYVPQASEHAFVLNLTWLVVVMAGLYAAIFLRIWLYGPTNYQHKIRA